MVDRFSRVWKQPRARMVLFRNHPDIRNACATIGAQKGALKCLVFHLHSFDWMRVHGGTIHGQLGCIRGTANAGSRCVCRPCWYVVGLPCRSFLQLCSKLVGHARDAEMDDLPANSIPESCPRKSDRQTCFIWGCP